jgi:hypothetical protein
MQKILLAVIAAAVVTIGLTVNFATATHEPADKTAATASSVDEVNDTVTLLEETMRVSSTSDLILSTTAECSILTALQTVGGQNKATEQDGAFGQVELWIKIDNKVVPVSGSSAGEGDNGEVVFCNRAYQRTVTDNEQNEDGLPAGNAGGVRDGIDTEDDFIRTRTANGFNWMAFDVGKVYDADGDNKVTIKLLGRFTKQAEEDGVASADATCERDGDDPRPDEDLTPYGDTCADAYVGKRSLIVEAVHASNHENSISGTQ